jgi:hypothetical protein
MIVTMYLSITGKRQYFGRDSKRVEIRLTFQCRTQMGLKPHKIIRLGSHGDFIKKYFHSNIVSYPVDR